MKVTLSLLPLIALVSVSSAHAVTNYNNSRNTTVITYSNSQDSYVASGRDITEAIQSLSRQAQQKEDRLNSFATRLSTQSNNTIISVPSSNYGYSSGNLLAVRPISSSMPVTSGFGYRYIFGKTQFHKGIDFGAPVGTPVYATGNGVVTYSGMGTGYGRYIEIDHGNGLVTRYGHMSANYVNVGDTVSANQQIGASGNSGRSTGPHLHYEVRQNGQAINPQSYLAMAPAR